MARKPLPTGNKVIKGTFQNCRAPADVPEFEPVDVFPDPPIILNPDGIDMWNKVGPQLIAAKVLQTADLYMLEQMCYSWQRFRQTARAGSDITAAENNALRGMFAEFGMTPASRTKVSTGGEKPAGNKFASNGKRVGNQ